VSTTIRLWTRVSTIGAAIAARVRGALRTAPREEQPGGAEAVWSEEWRCLPARHASWIALALLPALITVGMIQYYYGAQTGCMLPAFNDDVSHWHQIKTFSQAGFRGGYYTWNERTARLPFHHFGNWGAGFPVLFGSLAKVFGWRPDSAVYYNVTVLTLSLLLFVFTARPTPSQTAVLTVLLATFWPLLLYIPRTMQTTLHVSFAILFAALLHARNVNPAERRSRLLNLCFAVLLALAAGVQFTWLLIIIPWVLVRPGALGARQTLVRAAAGGALVAMGAVYFKWTVAPYAIDNAGVVFAAARIGIRPVLDAVKPRLLFMATLRGDVFESILWLQCAILLTVVVFLLRHWAASTLRAWAARKPVQFAILALSGVAIALLVVLAALGFQRPHYFIPPLAVLVYPKVVALVRRIGNRDSQSGAAAAQMDSLTLAAGLSVFVMLATAVLFGYPDEHRAYRLVAPFFLVGCLLLILGRHLRAALVVVAAAVIGIPEFFPYCRALQGWFSCAAMADTRQFELETRPHLVYDPTAGPWCNTLLFEVNAFQSPLVAVPGGVGLSFIYSTDFQVPLRSKFVMVGPSVLKALEAKGVHLKRLTDTKLGVLYRNADAACP
jgi:hypothetical protein